MDHDLFFWNKSQLNTMAVNGDNGRIIGTSWNKYDLGIDPISITYPAMAFLSLLFALLHENYIS